MKSHIQKLDIKVIKLICTVIALVLAIYTAYQYRVLLNAFNVIERENTTLASELNDSQGEVARLTEETINQQGIIESFSGQIESITSTVGDLEKLSQTDPELLKKYSKVFFLNENYVPAKLTDIEKKYVYNGTTNFLIHGDVWPYLHKLLDDAREDGIDLLVASAFRSFDTQASLKLGYTFIYGAGTANQFSADQGYSEHQLGTSVDFTTATVGGVFSKFQADPAYKWLEENAYKYGFILSYPEGNSYYKFEPWHWRFVGTSLAKYLHLENKNFYDLGQREIDPYLINIFD